MIYQSSRQRTEPPRIGRAARRLLVLGVYLGYAALVGGWALTSTFNLGLPFFLLTIPGALVMLGALAKLYTSAPHRMANETDDRLDERQRLVRNEAFRASYILLAALCVVGVVYGGIAWDNDWLWLPDTRTAVQAVVWGVFLLVMTLPTAVLAWTEPDDLAEEA